MSFHVRLVKGIIGGGIIGPQTESSIDIRGNSSSATIEHTTYNSAKSSSTTRKIESGPELDALMNNINSFEKLPQFSGPVPSDVFGKNTSVLITKDGKMAWAYGVQSGCTYDDSDSDFAISSENKTAYSNLVDQLNTFGTSV